MEVTEEPPVRAIGRLNWLDFFRGVSVLLMIETHVANTFLRSEAQATAWFASVTYLNGLVAPSFLFIAGFAQGLRWQKGGGAPVRFFRQLRRLGGIALVGYALHVPFPQMWGGRWEEALRLGTQVDILPCLAVSLFVLLGMTWAAERAAPRWRDLVWWTLVAGLLLTVVLFSRGFARWDGGAVPMRAFVNGSTGSLFPLFPWAAFVFAGALCGAMATRPVFVRLLAWGIVSVLGQAIPSTEFSAASAEFFFERLGWVMGFALLCEWLVPKSAEGWICFAGRESLWMYLVHTGFIAFLVIGGLASGKEMSMAATVGWLLVVASATFALVAAKAQWRLLVGQPRPKPAT